MAEEYILAQPAAITLRAEDADRLLTLGSGDAALLYLWLLRHGGRYDPAQASSELKLSAPLEACMAMLRSVGLVRGEGAEKKEAPERQELPEPTAEEVRREAETDGRFRMLVDETAQRLGRVLSGGDLKILYGIYHDLGLPTDVLMVLMNFCLQDIQRRFGPGRKPTLRQIERLAYIWSREEIFTLELADRWILEQKDRRGRTGELARLLGIQGRALAPREETYLLSWLDMGFGQDAVLLAYDKTVSKKGELAWPYMNRILENWHAKGLHTLPEIEAGDAPPRRKTGQAPAPAGPTSEEYVRMQKYLSKLNGGGDHGT